MEKRIKSVFLTGLAVSVPIGLTVYIFFFLIGIMDSLLLIVPDAYQPSNLLGVYIPGLGVVFTLVLIFICGLMTKSYLGKRAVILGERLVSQIPILRSVYQASKHVVDSFVMGKGRSFQQVVLVRFPHRDIFALGFVTSICNGEIEGKIGRKSVSVFVPTTPNPTSGFFLMIPQEDVIPVKLTVEEAFVMIMSVGIVNAPGRKIIEI